MSKKITSPLSVTVSVVIMYIATCAIIFIVMTVVLGHSTYVA